MSAPTPIAIKLQDAAGNIRRLTCDGSFAGLQKHAATDTNPHPSFSWTDEDGDDIVVNTDADLAEALRCAAPGTLKLLMDGDAAPPAEEPPQLGPAVFRLISGVQGALKDFWASPEAAGLREEVRRCPAMHRHHHHHHHRRHHHDHPAFGLKLRPHNFCTPVPAGEDGLPEAPLGFGAFGPGVEQLQRALIKAGVMPEDAIRFKAGWFGPATAKAVASLHPDGNQFPLYSGAVRTKLLELMPEEAPEEPAPWAAELAVLAAMGLLPSAQDRERVESLLAEHGGSVEQVIAALL